MSNSLRYIWVIRHAKSGYGDRNQADHDRTLNDRGVRDGGTMRAWLASQPHPAQWIWTSSAVRAASTAGFVAAGTGGHIATDASLYLSGPEGLLATLRATPVEVTSAAVVAHNPGLTHLCNLLSPAPVTNSLPTFGIALFSSPADWADLAFGRCELVALTSPKQLKPE